jgi:YidC/Oxa1 family membrane protein insertase
LHGSVNLVGGRIDDLTLVGYNETIEAGSPEIVLLAPGSTEKPYYAEFGWRGEGVETPTSTTLWQANSNALTPDKPLVLRWQNSAGLAFTRTIAVDKDYMFSVTDSVANAGEAAVTLYPYSRVLRAADLNHLTTYILHEGPVGVLNDKLVEDSYKSLQEKEPVITRATTGGWLGFTDKYWLVALIPDQKAPVTTRVLHAEKLGSNRFQADFTGATQTIATGASAVSTTHLFAGAKQVRLLDGYEKTVGVPRFDLAIDFGWYYFLTKPFFYAIDFLARFLGNFGLAILAFTVLIKLALFPLANHSYVSMTKMKAVAPKVAEMRDLYKGDPQRMSKEMMELYKREKINPLSGCWPILIQIPIFFSLYKVLFVTIEMRHAPFFGWLKDLSSADPSNVFNFFGLLSFMPPAFLHIGILPILMGTSMWLQMKMNPPPTDETQKFIFGIMPWIFVLILAKVPAGLVLYWTWSNVLSIAQQYVIMRRMKVRVFD